MISIDSFYNSSDPVQTPIVLSNSTTKNAVIKRISDLQLNSGNAAGFDLALNNAIRVCIQ